MSKAFTREDVDPPVRSRRVRSASGLPPGATNYITPRGATRLRQELAKLSRAGGDDWNRIAELERILGSVTVVELQKDPAASVGFGARVTVCGAANQLETYCLLGVDELNFDPDAVSWSSALGRILLAAELGDQVTLPETGSAKIVKIDYPAA